MKAGLEPERDFQVRRFDVLVGKHLAQGIYGSIGYGRDNEDRQVGYVQLTAYF